VQYSWTKDRARYAERRIPVSLRRRTGGKGEKEGAALSLLEFDRKGRQTLRSVDRLEKGKRSQSSGRLSREKFLGGASGRGSVSLGYKQRSPLFPGKSSKR